MTDLPPEVNEEAVPPDPYAGVSSELRQLFIAADKAKPKAAQKFAEEENPVLMALFIGGPIVDNGNGTFDCTFHHPIYGDVPFTASPDDDVAYGRAAHAYIAANLAELGGATRREV